MKVLIIEDEFKLADMIRDFFVSQGDAAEICTDGLSGYKRASLENFDALILDVMLPEMDGFEVLKKLRDEGKDIPTLMLTARSSLNDKLEGFNSGAKDYLTKPFEMEELYVRIKILGGKNAAIGKTDSPEQNSLLSYGNINLNCASRDLSNTETGKKVLLPAKEYLLMELLLKNPAIILSKEQITEHIWGYESEAEYNHEEVYISFLRKKLKFIDSDIVIDTVRGAGYRLLKSES